MGPQLALTVFCVVLAGAKAMLGEVVVDNTVPRTDTNGDIVNAHQGDITWSDKEQRYFWVGCAWVPCREMQTGCASSSWGSCGFDNNNISVYSSTTLNNTGWRIETKDALPRSNRAVGSYWQPNMAWNDATQLWVLWWVFSAPGASASDTVAQAATSKTPQGPFVLANGNISTRFPTFTSAELFVDGSDGYVVYSSRQGSVDVPPVVEKLAPSWVETTGQVSVPLKPFPPSGISTCNEGEVLFKRGGIFYLLMGQCCCFCQSGTNLLVFTASHPLGPYTQQGEINPMVNGSYILPTQQQGVTVIGRSKGQDGDPQMMWSGERWQQSPDGQKEHDPQAWVPLAFHATGVLAPLSNTARWKPGDQHTSVTVLF